jgi:hypothetical protein
MKPGFSDCSEINVVQYKHAKSSSISETRDRAFIKEKRGSRDFLLSCFLGQVCMSAECSLWKLCAQFSSLDNNSYMLFRIEIITGIGNSVLIGISIGSLLILHILELLLKIM